MQTASHRVEGIRRQLRKKAPLEGGGTGFTTVPDGYESATVEVDADLAAIARMLGTRAMGNKSGKAKFLHGLVTVRVINRKREG